MGKKRVKGEGALHDEQKKQVGVWLTPEAIASLDKTAQEQDISRSELVERYARDPLAFLEWTRSHIKTDFEWVIFWEAVEESICYRQGKAPYKLNALAILKLLKTEDLSAGLAKLEKMQNVENTTNNVLS